MNPQRPTDAPASNDWLDGLLRQVAEADRPEDAGFSDAVLRALPTAPSAVTASHQGLSSLWRPLLCSLGLALLALCALALWPQWQALQAWWALLAQQPEALADPRLTSQWLAPLLMLAAPLGLWLWWSLSLAQESWSPA